MSQRLLTGFVKKPSVREKIIKAIERNPRLAEFGIGGLAGSGLGAATGYAASKDKKKGALRGALIGGLAGGGLAVGSNKLLQTGATKAESTLNKKVVADFRKDVNKMHGIYKSVPDLAVDKAYKNMYKYKKDTYNKLKERQQLKKQYAQAQSRAKNVSGVIKRFKANADSNMREADLVNNKNFLRQGLVEGKILRERARNEMAKTLANLEAKKKFEEKFIKGLKDIDVVSDNKNKIFGGFKSVKGVKKEISSLARKSSDFKDLVMDHRNEAILDDTLKHPAFGNKRIRELSNRDWYTHKQTKVDLDEIKNSSKLKDMLRDIKKGAYKDMKAGRPGQYFDEKIKSETAKSFSSLSKDELNNLAKTLGSDLNNFKTKADVLKSYKAAARKYHPDINKSPEATEKMKNITEAMDKIKKSDWFNKLSFLDEDLIYKIAAKGKVVGSISGAAKSTPFKRYMELLKLRPLRLAYKNKRESDKAYREFSDYLKKEVPFPSRKIKKQIDRVSKNKGSNDFVFREALKSTTKAYAPIVSGAGGGTLAYILHKRNKNKEA